MTWEAVVLHAKYKGFVIQVYKRMDDIGWGVRVFPKGVHLSSSIERRIDGMSLLRAKKLGRKIIIKLRKTA